jgi:histidinol-phosphate/aromatic aminotransferase/cobyric acid decarboxylase-like protein
VAELAKHFPGLLLIDEAYADFADDNCLALVKKHRNVIVIRTMSKAYSLAGMRFGYAVAQPDVIAEMMKVKDSYNCDAVSICAATAAIEDQDYARQNWEYVRRERQKVSSALTELGWTVLDSHANFILAAAPDGNGREAYLGLKKQGILVRYFDKPGLSDKIRITIGTMQQNTALLAGVAELAAGADKHEKTEKAERSEKSEKAEKPEAKPEKNEKPDKVERNERAIAARADKAERQERLAAAAEKAERAESVVNAKGVA